jgi:hypothetical protein
MDLQRSLTGVVRELLWITGANILGSQPEPNLMLLGGLSHALMLEQPTLRCPVMDVGPAANYRSE